METDEWLQILAQHPIFSEPKDAVQSKSDTFKSSISSARRERVVVRGTDLFIAVGKEVRWINIKACKDAFVRFESKRMGLRGAAGASTTDSKQDTVSNVPWYRLGCEALSFDICKLAINSSGKLLVAMGVHQVAIVVLPPPGAITKSSSSTGGAFNTARQEDPDNENNKGEGVWFDCRSMLVGTAGSSTTTAFGGNKNKGADKRRSSGIGSGLSVAANWSARTRVVDVLWHPLSTNDSHLMVLHATGAIKVFDVSEDLDTPEQIVSLFGTNGTGSAAFAMSRAVSFCLGSNTSAGWSRATVYVLTNSGELYSLCPLLPRRCSIEREWLECLLESAKLDVREWQAEEYETSEYLFTPPELIAARAAVKWLHQLLDLEKNKTPSVLPTVTSPAAGATDSDHMYLTLPASLIQPAVLQGPYLFQPEPTPVGNSGYDSEDSSSGYISDGSNGDNTNGCDADDACDVLYLQPGNNDGGAGVGLVAIAYCDSHVEVFADLEPVICRWTSLPNRGAHGQGLPVLATLASIDLAVNPLTGAEDALQRSSNRRIGAAVTLQKDTLSPAVFYALHQHGVHRVDVRKWAVLLDKAIGLDNDKIRNAALEKLLYALDGRGRMPSALPTGSSSYDSSGQGALARSCVQCILHTYPRASQPAIPVVGAATVDDIYLSYSLLALVAPCQLVGIVLPLLDSPDEDVEPEKNDAESNSNRRRIDLSLGAKDVVYVPRLPKDGYKLPAILGSRDAVVQQPRFVLREDNPVNEDDEVSEEKLKLLGSVVGQLHTQLAAIIEAHSNMRKHLDLQVQEHRRQHDKLSAISLGFQKHFEELKNSQKRMDALQENGQRLGLRVDQALRQLLSYYQPEITPSERAFAQEVRGMELRVNSADGHHQAVERLQERVNDMLTLTRSAARARDAAAASRTMSTPQLSKAALEKIRATLDNEQSNLKETCERITEMQTRVEDICESQTSA
ncbi:hypothetical protein BX070DRAFT_223031 [Coemansia spiralis]|nr:hypothetical protein BX070DRAFT_223031 [Coemansia spiralis]